MRRRDVLVQPFVEEVDTNGEHAIVFIGDRYSHAARKLPFHGIPPDGVDLEERIDLPLG